MQRGDRSQTPLDPADLPFLLSFFHCFLLAVSFTGTEALFADLGHFSQMGIIISFTTFVYPCLVICYLGQAAWLTGNYGMADPATGTDISNAAGYTNVFWWAFE